MKYELAKINATCPLCAQDHCHRLYSVTAEKAAQHYVLREVFPERHARLVRYISRLWDHDDCSLVRCSNCQFVFAFPFRSGGAEFYSLAYTYGAEKYPREKWEYDETIRHLEHRRGRQNRYLEIGAGSGAFVRKVIPDFVEPASATCIEYSQNGLEALLAMGIQCLNQDVRSATELNGSQFDVICLFQVLEHMDDLDQLFTRLRQITSN